MDILNSFGALQGGMGKTDGLLGFLRKGKEAWVV